MKILQSILGSIIGSLIRNNPTQGASGMQDAQYDVPSQQQPFNFGQRVQRGVSSGMQGYLNQYNPNAKPNHYFMDRDKFLANMFSSLFRGGR